MRRKCSKAEGEGRQQAGDEAGAGEGDGGGCRRFGARQLAVVGTVVAQPSSARLVERAVSSHLVQRHVHRREPRVALAQREAVALAVVEEAAEGAQATVASGEIERARPLHDQRVVLVAHPPQPLLFAAHQPLRVRLHRRRHPAQHARRRAAHQAHRQPVAQRAVAHVRLVGELADRHHARLATHEHRQRAIEPLAGEVDRLPPLAGDGERPECQVSRLRGEQREARHRQLSYRGIVSRYRIKVSYQGIASWRCTHQH